MIIVSDTSPVSNLLIIGQLDILSQLFGEIIIPPKVFEEIQRLESFEIDIEEIKNSDWIKIIIPSNVKLVQELNENLDEGESEAIALAKELNAEFILIDEKKGRKVAEQLGITAIGLLGILLKAKQKRAVERIMPLLDSLRQDAGFWISDVLYHDILMQAEEI